MSTPIVTTVNQLTPASLTQMLLTAGALTAGRVSAVHSDGGAGNWSTNAIMYVRYTDDADGERPPRLFLKMVNTDLGDESFGNSEVTYYSRDYVDVADAPLLRCYSAAYSAEKKRYHLLLEDVSQTHVEATHRAPTLAYGRALASGLATLHARWWGAQRLQEAGAALHSEDHLRRFIAIAEPGAEHIIQRLSAELKPHWPVLMRECYTHLPRVLIERMHDANGYTLIHGDVGCTNILVARDGIRPIYIIDRQPFDWSLTTWLGAYDLAYALVLDWDSVDRQRWERPILEQYHARLRALGITDYSWQRLFDDYRLSVAMGVYIATEYCRGGINERWRPLWLAMLQRALTACDQLQCRDLWR
jgi:hypothetical protein